MKRILLLAFIIPFFSCAQNFYKPGSFVIKGRVKNFKGNLFDFGMSTYFSSTGNSVIVKPNGNFEQQFPVQHLQDVYFYLNDDAISFTVLDKDTITLEWDETDFKNTFSVSGKNELRTKELQMQLRLYNEFRKPFMDLNTQLYSEEKKLTNENKFNLINELYNRNVGSVIGTGDFFTEMTEYQITAVYFRYTNLLRTMQMLPEFKLKLILDSSNKYYYGLIPENKMRPVKDSATARYIDIASSSSQYSELNETWFWNVPEYRDFIYDYVRFFRPFHSWWSLTPEHETDFNPILNDYYMALSNINITVIRDWFLTYNIMSGFGFYTFSDVEKVYKKAVGAIAVPYLKDTLQKYYTAIKRLKPGSTAPGFYLKNETGKTVSLNEFKGKVVYVDFWGVGCGPCIYDIENHVPKLHDHYQNKDIVFVNICVDATEVQWKEALAKYKLKGINLLAKGWTANPVCKAYNVSSIPHYILIDKLGKIANNNAPRAQAFDLENGQNAIDQLLKAL